MKTPRFTLLHLCVLVAVVAIDLAALRALVWWGDERFFHTLDWVRERGLFHIKPNAARVKSVLWSSYLINVYPGPYFGLKRQTIIFALAPLAVALHIAVDRLFRGRDASRAFWAGFVAGGLVGAVSLVLTWMADGPIADAWCVYLVRVQGWTVRAGLGDLRFGPGHPIARDALLACIYGVPLFIAALAGGVIAHLIRVIARLLAGCWVRLRRGDGQP
jgi:hypothetical protein